MIIRPATLSDVNQIVEIAYKHSAIYTKLIADKNKIRNLVIDSISAAKNYSLVVELNNRIEGVLLAFTSNNSWAQRQNCAVMLWVSSVPGAGASMLRQFRNWILSRRAIKVAGFAPDIDVDPRVWMLANRIGFKQHGGAFLLYN